VNLTALWEELVIHGTRDDDHRHDLAEQVSAARREWQAAQQYFQSVSEPQQVDNAVHALIAAEQKYMALLRKLKAFQTQGG
jgi:hypothetical protein